MNSAEHVITSAAQSFALWQDVFLAFFLLLITGLASLLISYALIMWLRNIKSRINVKNNNINNTGDLIYDEDSKYYCLLQFDENED